MTYESNYLAHYGIPNMRWGHRRFQYQNGTLTPEGKERYRKGKADSEKKTDDKAPKGVIRGIRKTPESKTWRPEEASDLSDEELNRRNSRLQRERQYRDMTTPQWKKDARQIASETLKRVFIGTAATLAVVAMRKNYEKIGDWISKQANQKLSEIRQPQATRNAIQLAASRYGDGGSRARSMESPKMSAYRRYSSGRS